jgi:hypothetical protein
VQTEHVVVPRGNTFLHDWQIIRIIGLIEVTVFMMYILWRNSPFSATIVYVDFTVS